MLFSIGQLYRAVGSIVAIALFSTMITTTAGASEPLEPKMTESVVLPTNIDLVVDNTADSGKVLIATTDEELEEGSRLFLFEEGNPQYVASIDSVGTEHIFEASSLPPNDGENYYVQIGDVISNTVYMMNSMSISLSISSGSYHSDDPLPILSWTASESIYPTGFSVYLVDITNDKIVIEQKPSNNSGTVVAPRQRSGPPIEYRAYIAARGLYPMAKTLAELDDIQAESNSVTAERGAWSINITTNNTVFDTENALPVISWAVNQSTSLTDYSVYMLDETEDVIYSVQKGNLADANKAGSHPIKRFIYGGPHSFRAIVAKTATLSQVSSYNDLEEIQAESNSLSFKRSPWTVSLSKSLNRVLSDGAKEMYYRFEANQKIYNSGYRFYLVDSITGNIVNVSEPGVRWGIKAIAEYPSSSYVFVSYIAKKDLSKPTPTHVSQLEDIQAISGVVANSENGYSNTNKQYSRGGGNASDNHCSQVCVGDPVNSLTGEFFENVADISVNSLTNLSFGRSYSTYSKNSIEDYGRGWRHNYRLDISGEGASLNVSNILTVTQENGASVTFLKLHDGTYTAGGTIHASLEYDNLLNSYVFSRDELTRYFFNSEGILTQWEDNNNNSLTFTYSSSGKLSQILSSDGANLTITWSSGDDKIVEVTDGTQTVEYEYSPAGNLAIVESSHKAGLRQYVYDPTNHRITRVIHENGGIWLNEYDTSNRVTKQTNAEGHETEFAYTTSGTNNITTITHPDGTLTEQTYNESGNLILQKFAKGTSEEMVFSTEYDNQDRKIKEYGPSGLLSEYTYDSKGNVLTVKDPLNRVTSYTYNNKNQVVDTTNALNEVATNVYDVKGNLVKVISFGGKETEIVTNSNGTVHTVRSQRSITLGDSNRITYSYDTRGNPTTVALPTGGTTVVTYNNLGLPVSVSDADSNQTEYIYNSQGLLTKTINPNLSEMLVTYTSGGQVSSTTDTLGRIVEQDYDLLGNIITQTNSWGTAEYEYNSMNRLTKMTSPNGVETEYIYNSLGMLIEVSNQFNTTTYEYYNNGLLSKATDGNNRTTEYFYDSVGNPVKVKYSNQEESTSQYDELNRIIKTQSSNGYYETFVYDLDNNLLSKTTADLNTTTYEYDDNDNLKTVRYSDMSTEIYNYDLNDSVQSYTDRDGKTVSYERNSLDQISKVTHSDLSSTSYSYDNMGQLEAISYDDWITTAVEYDYSNSGLLLSESTINDSTTYSYDSIGQLTSRGPPTSLIPNKRIDYTYSPYGELSSVTYPHGETIGYTYGLDGNLSEVRVGSNVVAEYTHDSLGNPTEILYGNNVKESFEYDQLNLKSSRKLTKGLHTYWKEDLSRDEIGLILSRNVSDNSSLSTTTNYNYDALSRLGTVDKSDSPNVNNYSYDMSNNLVSSPFGNNTLTSNGAITRTETDDLGIDYLYDLRGNRTDKTATDLSTNLILETTEYEWSEANELLSLVKTSPSETLTVNYEYNTSSLASKRTSSVDNGISVSTDTENYIWDSNNPIPILIEDDSNVYIYDNDSTPFLQIDKTTNQYSYLHGNSQNSVIAATLSDGNLSWQRTYDEYGTEYIETPNPGKTQIETPFAYTGEYLDNLTNLYNLRARWYEPTSGSFISVDPLQSQTGEAYSYGSGDPVNNTDPTGLFSLTDAISGAADGLVGFPLSSVMGNIINPGGANTCSSSYILGSFIGMVGSFFIPWMGIFKTLALIFTWIKYLNLYGKIAKVNKSIISSVKSFKNEVVTKFKSTHGRTLADRESGSFPHISDTPKPPKAYGWKVGDPIDKLTWAGTKPRWGTIRARYWKNEAAEYNSNPNNLTSAQIKRESVEKIKWKSKNWSPEQIKRMQSGRAPQREHPKFGFIESMELSHEPIPQRDGGTIDVIQRWPQEHAAVDSHRRLGKKYG